MSFPTLSFESNSQRISDVSILENQVHIKNELLQLESKPNHNLNFDFVFLLEITESETLDESHEKNLKNDLKEKFSPSLLQKQYYFNILKACHTSFASIAKANIPLFQLFHSWKSYLV